jgi:large subunit ribosomal protein L6
VLYSFKLGAVRDCLLLRHQVEKNTTLIISGSSKEQLGAYCAMIRRQRPPEPYKGKGIRYAGEVIKLKEGKGGGKKK